MLKSFDVGRVLLGGVSGVGIIFRTLLRLGEIKF